MKLGLALSGGGVRGIAHAGVLRALEENNIKVDMIGGTSSGSLVAALYGMGYGPYYIYELFKKYGKEITGINKMTFATGVNSIFLNKRLKLSGLNTGESIEKIYDELAEQKGIKNISDIKMPIAIPAVDITESNEYIFTNAIPQKTKNKKFYINNISVGKAVRASSSFPVVFSPCDFENHKFLDGGTLDNIPAIQVKKLGADKVISINFDADTIDEQSNIMDIVMKTLDIMGNKISEKSMEKSDFILTIPSDKAGLLDIEKIDTCYKLGYDTAMQNMTKILEIISE
jgi:NTE family protein